MSTPILRNGHFHPPAVPVRPAIKVCGLTRPEDIRFCLAERVNYLGINRHPASPRFVHDDDVKPLLDLIPNGRRVYVAVAPGLPEIATADRAGFDFFQIHFDPLNVPEKRVAMWADAVGSERLWLAPRLAGGTTFPIQLIKYAAAFLIDGYSPQAYGGTGKTADWSGAAALKSVHPEVRWIVAGGLNPENIADAARTSHADVLDLNSGIEDTPGHKSLAKLQEAIAKLNSGFTTGTISGTLPPSGMAPISGASPISSTKKILPPPGPQRKLRL